MSTTDAEEPGSEIFAEAAELERNCLRWVQAHRSAAESWNRVHLSLGIPGVALATAAGATVLAGKASVLAGILALVAAVCSGLMTWLDPRSTAELHRAAANGYLAIAGDAGRLRRIDRFAGRSVDELRQTLYDLARRLDEQTAKSPYVARRFVRRFRDEAGERG